MENYGQFEPLIAAVKEAGKEIKKLFGTSLEIEEKSTIADFRTKADLTSEKIILASIEKNYPAYAVHSEENGKNGKDSEYQFVIDPLDGTNNFVIGVPEFSISVGLLHGNETIMGLVYNPILDLLYFAEKGKGAFANGKRIEVSKETNLSRPTIAYNATYHTTSEEVCAFRLDLNKKGFRRWMESWSPALDLCLVASGKVECMTADHPDIYDFLAGKLIAKEAGAVSSDWNGNIDSDTNDQFIVSCNQAILDDVIGVTESRVLKK